MYDMAASSLLPKITLETLNDVCAKLAISSRIVTHKPTFSASETQAVLPAGCLVQKTVTGQAADKLVL